MRKILSIIGSEMRPYQFILIGWVLGLAAVVVAQDATLTTPLTQTKYKIRSFYVVNPPIGATAALIDLSSQDSGGNELGVLSKQVPGCGTSTVAGLATAMITVRASETGTDTRKLQFRILGYLFDQGCLPASTLNP